MKPFTLLPARTVVHCGCRFSTSYSSARASAALAPQLTHPFSLLDVLAPLPDRQLMRSNVRHLRTLPIRPLHDTQPAVHKSP